MRRSSRPTAPCPTSCHKCRWSSCWRATASSSRPARTQHPQPGHPAHAAEEHQHQHEGEPAPSPQGRAAPARAEGQASAVRATGHAPLARAAGARLPAEDAQGRPEWRWLHHCQLRRRGRALRGIARALLQLRGGDRVFRLSHTQTYASCQGTEFHESLTLWELGHRKFAARHLFVGISRAQRAEQVRLASKASNEYCFLFKDMAFRTDRLARQLACAKFIAGRVWHTSQKGAQQHRQSGAAGSDGLVRAGASIGPGHRAAGRARAADLH